MIKFDEMEVTVLDRFYGGEGCLNARMKVDELNKIMRSCLAKGCSVGYHIHDASSEIIFILSGVGISNVDGVEETVSAGDCIYCKKGSSHSLRNERDEDLVFYAVVPKQ